MYIFLIFGISKCMIIWVFNLILFEVCNCDEKGWGWGFYCCEFFRLLL